jgi:penicillin-binding protein 1C
MKRLKFKRPSKKTLIVLLSILAFIVIAVSIDVGVNRKIGILNGTRFSGAYTDVNGKLLGVYLTPDDTFRVYKSITEYPPEFIEAILLQEDKRFYVHNGINFASLMRSFTETYIKRGRRIGGSTITMQVAKLKYGLYTKNIWGKLKQIFLALRLDFIYSKQDILDAYVNLAPCGKNIEGFETASQYFFHKSVGELSLSEILMLCVLPQNPNKRCPSLTYVPPELLDARVRLFNTWIEDHPKDKELLSFLEVNPALECSFPQYSPHFTRVIELSRDEKSFYGKAGPVQTTLDFTMNEFIRELLESYVRKNQDIGINNASAVLIDSSTMSVQAYVGSAGFYNDEILGQVDGIISKRSPGSTLKPFIYALAMEQGIIHYDTMLKDSPSSFSEYSPDNYGNTFMGPVKAWYALVQSRNIPAVNLAGQIKNPDLYEFMENAGITELKDRDTYGLSIVLGSADVSALELCSLYSVFLNGGVQYPLNNTFPLKPKEAGFGKKLLTPQSTYIVKQILFKNPRPDKSEADYEEGFEVGYKTGTSVGFKDCWAVGFFGKYILCVWIGNFDGLGNNSFLGRTAAAPLFFNMVDAITSRGYVDYTLNKMPEGVQKVKVCSVSGDICNDDCPYEEETYFIPGVSPITKCKIHRKINIDTRTGYRTDETDAPYVKTVVREYWPSDLMALFKQAGLPRIVPPDYPPEDSKISDRGFPPEITSPLKNVEYVFDQTTPSRNVIILSANADASSKELFWFNGDAFIGKSKPGEKMEWRPKPGAYDIIVLDDKGRSSSRNLNISVVAH